MTTPLPTNHYFAPSEGEEYAENLVRMSRENLRHWQRTLAFARRVSMNQTMLRYYEECVGARLDLVWTAQEKLKACRTTS